MRCIARKQELIEQEVGALRLLTRRIHVDAHTMVPSGQQGQEPEMIDGHAPHQGASSARTRPYPTSCRSTR